MPENSTFLSKNEDCAEREEERGSTQEFTLLPEPLSSEIKISDEVIAAIASTAASQVEGVASMAGSIVNDIGGAILGRKNIAKGVRVTSTGKDITLDLYLSVKYGARIPEVAYKVQGNVKKTVESMTDLRVMQVNIHVQGVTFYEQARVESNP